VSGGDVTGDDGGGDGGSRVRPSRKILSSNPLRFTRARRSHVTTAPLSDTESIQFLESRWLEYPRSAHYRSGFRFKINSAVSLGQSPSFLFRFTLSGFILANKKLIYNNSV